MSALSKEKANCEICGTSSSAVKVASGWDFEYGTCHDEFEMARCVRCGLLYISNRPSQETLSIIYPANYYSYQESDRQVPLVRTIREIIEKRKGEQFLKYFCSGKKTIFDLGCGDGRLLDIIQKLCPTDWDLAGIEISEPAVEKAVAKGYSVVHGDFESYDTSKWAECCDLVLMHQVIEHMRQPRMALKKINAMLRPGGLLSLETPDTNSWDHYLFEKRYWGGYHFPRHFHLFNKRNITTLLQQEGFDIIYCKSLLSPVFWIHSIHNILMEKNRYPRLTKFFNYQNPILLSFASLIDVLQLITTSKSSNMQVLATKNN